MNPRRCVLQCQNASANVTVGNRWRQTNVGPVAGSCSQNAPPRRAPLRASACLAWGAPLGAAHSAAGRVEGPVAHERDWQALLAAAAGRRLESAHRSAADGASAASRFEATVQAPPQVGGAVLGSTDASLLPVVVAPLPARGGALPGAAAPVLVAAIGPKAAAPVLVAASGPKAAAPAEGAAVDRRSAAAASPQPVPAETAVLPNTNTGAAGSSRARTAAASGDARDAAGSVGKCLKSRDLIVSSSAFCANTTAVWSRAAAADAPDAEEAAVAAALSRRRRGALSSGGDGFQRLPQVRVHY